MSESTFKDYLALPLRTFVDDLASTSPAPGGGSTAALTGALAAALGHMVAGFALRRATKQGEVTEPIQHMLDRLDRARGALAGLIAEDIAAYDLWRQASKADPNDPATPGRKQTALTAALAVPSQVLALCAACLRDIADLAPLSSRYLWTDLAAAAAIARAAAESAAWTVYANLSSPDLRPEDRDRVQGEIQQLLQSAQESNEDVTRFVQARLFGE